MKVSLEELRRLRAMLTVHRLEHELLVTKMQVLRKECQEMREEIAQRSRRDREASTTEICS